MSLSETIETLQKLQRIHQLNIELLETLAVACSYLTEKHVIIPNKNTFISLVQKAWTLLEEISADEPKIIQYTTDSGRKVADEKKQHFRTDEEEPVPRNIRFISGAGKALRFMRSGF